MSPAAAAITSLSQSLHSAASADPDGTDLDVRVDVHHRLTEAAEAVVVGIPLDVLGAVTGPHLLPSPRRAVGPAVDTAP